MPPGDGLIAESNHRRRRHARLGDRVAGRLADPARRRAAKAAACGANTSATRALAANLPAFFMRHWKPREVTFDMAQKTYESLVPWGRTRFHIVGGRLFYPDLKHKTFGCVLRRTPILAWALLQTLDRYPQLPDVDINVNCRDKPGSELGAGRPTLAFSYTTGVGFSDIPLPDYTYWGLPYVELHPWEAWLAASVRETRGPPAAGAPAAAAAFRWATKRDQMIWIGSPTNPLRSAFKACAPRVFGDRLVHKMLDEKQMHDLAWDCPPTAKDKPCDKMPQGWTPLAEQCRYKYILHLPGISDWLEHFKHQLLCGSVNIFLGKRPRSAAAAAAGLTSPSAFEHFDMSGPLLRDKEHFLFVETSARSVCRDLRAAVEMLERTPRRAECLARRGQSLASTLSMDTVYAYLAGVLTEASLRQRPGVARRAAVAEKSRLVTKQNFFTFIPPAKRPWIEHVFRHWHQAEFNNTPLLPPRAAETGSGLFH